MTSLLRMVPVLTIGLVALPRSDVWSILRLSRLVSFALLLPECPCTRLLLFLASFELLDLLFVLLLLSLPLPF